MSTRNPEAIIADYLATFVGDDNPREHWLPNAQIIINWLRDEGWVIVNEPEGHAEMVPENADECCQNGCQDEIGPCDDLWI